MAAVWALMGAGILSTPASLFAWWIAQHPDNSWGDGYRPAQ
ncbi:MAG: hypothetical protein WBO46_09800 [Caldilineaceae bacterium]